MHIAAQAYLPEPHVSEMAAVVSKCPKGFGKGRRQAADRGRAQTQQQFMCPFGSIPFLFHTMGGGQVLIEGKRMLECDELRDFVLPPRQAQGPPLQYCTAVCHVVGVPCGRSVPFLCCCTFLVFTVPFSLPCLATRNNLVQYCEYCIGVAPPTWPLPGVLSIFLCAVSSRIFSGW